ncbi:MAG: DUF6597 domain-containing transcriptional factor [Dehalococcoidia bacterium]
MGGRATSPRAQHIVGLAETGPSYREFAPPPRLKPFVVCLWQRESQPLDIYARVVPDGCIDIIWIGDDRLMVAGPATRAIVAESQDRTDYAGVRFPPGVAPSFLDVSADALIDRHVPLEAIWPAESRELLERAAGERAAGLKLDLLQRLLLKKQPDAVARDELVRAGITLLLRSATSSVGVLSDVALLSDRQLRRRFQVAVGYGPKTLHRILRFQRALSLIRNEAPAMRLVDIALASGYADQPHMVRDFVQLAGLPPARLARSQKSFMSNSFKKRAPLPSYD